MVDGEFNNTLTQSASSASNTVLENVAELQFGPDFEDIDILSNAQVAMILQMDAGNATTRDEGLNDIHRKTHYYVNRFNTMKHSEKQHQEVLDELDNLQEALQTYRVEIEDHHHGNNTEHQELELHGSEVSSLMNLVGTDTMVEEALALIPSLSRFPEASLDEILDLIRNTMIRIAS